MINFIEILYCTIMSHLLPYFEWYRNCLVAITQWKGINRKQSTRWQHLSRLKATAFFSFQKKFSCYETQQLILGTGIAIWWVTEPHWDLLVPRKGNVWVGRIGSWSNGFIAMLRSYSWPASLDRGLYKDSTVWLDFPLIIKWGMSGS